MPSRTADNPPRPFTGRKGRAPARLRPSSRHPRDSGSGRLGLDGDRDDGRQRRRHVEAAQRRYGCDCEIESFAADPVRIAEARSERRLAGFYYWDSGVLEGFTSPGAQQRAYSTLKSLFPDKLVLYPTRLDPIAWETGFLDDYFRPEFTDLVTPYFYPVGSTILGPAQENDAWEDRLAGLLSDVARRVPEGKGVLPVLQGFQQDGYPLSARFPLRQMSVYRRFWPDLPNAAVDAWRFAQPQPPLVELADLPTLQRGVCGLFADLRTGYATCRWGREIPWR